MTVKQNLEFIKCNLCNSNSYKFERKLNGFTLVKCKNCGLVYVNPRPKPTNIVESYKNEKETEKIMKWYKNQEANKKPDNLRRINIIKEEISFKCKKSLKLLDLGCGDLFFLRLAKKENFDVFGLEIRKWAKHIARRYNISLYTKPLEECNIKENSFDVIHSDSVFEHLTNPKGVLKECYKILRRGANYDKCSKL
ncbi:MAG: class I SAM-dependent methyltransferase [Candidatus Omnitrophica bacterium]|nr:class I SAM-dependent methyltransferase [Candidatus Omnitrophota bacterium]